MLLIGARTDGVLFVRSGESTSPYTGPTAFLYSGGAYVDGTIKFRLKSDNDYQVICTGALAPTTSTTPRQLRLARDGTEISVHVHTPGASPTVCSETMTQQNADAFDSGSDSKEDEEDEEENGSIDLSMPKLSSRKSSSSKKSISGGLIVDRLELVHEIFEFVLNEVTECVNESFDSFSYTNEMAHAEWIERVLSEE